MFERIAGFVTEDLGRLVFLNIPIYTGALVVSIRPCTSGRTT